MTVVRPAPCNWLISSSSCCSSWVWYWLTAAVRTVDAAVFCVLPLGKSSDSKSSSIAITPTVTASAVRFLLLCKERKAESNSFFFTVCSPPLPWERCPVSAAKS